MFFFFADTVCWSNITNNTLRHVMDQSQLNTSVNNQSQLNTSVNNQSQLNTSVNNQSQLNTSVNNQSQLNTSVNKSNDLKHLIPGNQRWHTSPRKESNIHHKN